MVIDMNYWTKVLRKIIILILMIIRSIFGIKISNFLYAFFNCIYTIVINRTYNTFFDEKG